MRQPGEPPLLLVRSSRLDGGHLAGSGLPKFMAAGASRPAGSWLLRLARCDGLTSRARCMFEGVCRRRRSLALAAAAGLTLAACGGGTPASQRRHLLAAASFTPSQRMDCVPRLATPRMRGVRAHAPGPFPSICCTVGCTSHGFRPARSVQYLPLGRWGVSLGRDSGQAPCIRCWARPAS